MNRDLFRRIEAQASELLKALGCDPDVVARGEDFDGRPVHLHPFCGPLALGPALHHLLEEVRAAAPPHRPTAAAVLCWLDGNKWFETLRNTRRDLARGALPPEADDDAEVVGDAEASALAALGMLPEILGILVALARRSVAVAEGDMASIRRREDAFRRDLFTELARARDHVGVPPRARDKAGNPNPAAIAWTRAVLGGAVERPRAACAATRTSRWSASARSWPRATPRSHGSSRGLFPPAPARGKPSLAPGTRLAVATLRVARTPELRGGIGLSAPDAGAAGAPSRSRSYLSVAVPGRDGEAGVGQHGKRDVPVPTGPGTHLGSPRVQLQPLRTGGNCRSRGARPPRAPGRRAWLLRAHGSGSKRRRRARPRCAGSTGPCASPRRLVGSAGYPHRWGCGPMATPPGLRSCQSAAGTALARSSAGISTEAKPTRCPEAAAST